MDSSRLVTLQDVPVLAELHRVNREFLAPFEPVRPDDYFTVAGQRAVIEGALARHEQGSVLPHVILDGSGQVVGRISLNEIVRGPLQSCSLGYWVSAAENGRGLATAADPGRNPAAQHRVAARTGAQRLRPDRRGAEVPQDRRPMAGSHPGAAVEGHGTLQCRCAQVGPLASPYRTR